MRAWPRSFGHSADATGYVYATTGAEYTILARRAARTLKRAAPDASIDLFTDQEVSDGVFDRIHRLRRTTRHPKVEALGRSRFDQTIMLDADTIALTDISELFGMARSYPLSAMIGWARPALLWREQRDIPRWYPYFNSGLLVFRKGARISQLSRAWSAAMSRDDQRYDQTPLRRLCWDLNIPVGIVPQEYNMIFAPALRSWKPYMGAPRLLHLRRLHDMPAGDPEKPFDLNHILPPEQVAMIVAQFEAEALHRAAPCDQPLWRRNRVGLAAIRVWKRLTL